jgi:hypothetical protein
MAVLSETDRQKVWRGLMRYWSQQQETLGLNKADLRAAVDATDDWIDANQGAFNSALPAAAQSNLTAAQKTMLFMTVALLRMDADFAVRLLGGLD